MHAPTAPARSPGIDRFEGFTIAGVLTGLAATAAVLVFGVFVTARIAQRGMRQAESAIDGIKSSIAGGLGSLGGQDPGAIPGPVDEGPGWVPAVTESDEGPRAPGAEPAAWAGPVLEFIPSPPVPWNVPYRWPRRAWPCRPWWRRPTAIFVPSQHLHGRSK